MPSLREITYLIFFAGIFLLGVLYLHRDGWGKLPSPSTQYWVRNADAALGIGLWNVKAWQKEGLFPWDWMIFTAPECVEFEGRLYRDPHAAYFPLAWLPLYGVTFGVADISRCIVRAQVFMVLAQVCWAFFLGAAVLYSTYRIVGPIQRLFLALGTMLLILGTPRSLWCFFYSYTADFLVLPLYAFAVFLYIIGYHTVPQSDDRKSRQCVDKIMAALIFLGCLIEWVFVPFAVCLWIVTTLENRAKHSTLREILRQSLYIFLPVAAALLVFFSWIAWQHAYVELAIKFLQRTAIVKAAEPESEFWSRFWWRYLPDHVHASAPYFIPAVFLAASAGLYFSFFSCRQRFLGTSLYAFRPLSALLFLVTVPCCLHALLLRDHYVETPYTALKFLMPFTVGWVCVAVILIAASGTSRAPRISALINNTVAGLFLMGIALCLVFQQDRTRALLQQDARDYAPFFSQTANLLPPQAKMVLMADAMATLTDTLNVMPFFMQPVWRLEDFPEWAARLTYRFRNTKQFLFTCTLLPPWLFRYVALEPLPPPEIFQVGVLYARGSEPPLIRALAPFAREVRQNAHYRLLVLEKADLERYSRQAAPDTETCSEPEK